jgi:uncharacterized protein (TIGR03435 family)
VAASLEPFADRPIVDMTGLKGRYDFAIDLTPEDYRAMRCSKSGLDWSPQGATRRIDHR